LHPDKLIRAVVDRSVVEPAFIAIALSTGSGRSAIEQRRKTTAGQVGIAGSELKKVPVPIPPLDEQRRILAEAERQLSIVAAMASKISRALRRSASLRRSILEQAFTGKLVPHDPSDEPASILLKRITAERAAASKPSRRGRKIPA
jgi:type I restriction enzyme S subunit